MIGTEQQLHSMARRHHATMKQLDGLRETWMLRKDRFVTTLETGTGAWFAGVVKGRTEGNPDPLARFVTHPLTLGLGALAIGYLDAAERWSDDVIHFGNGYLTSFFATKGFATGQALRARSQA